MAELSRYQNVWNGHFSFNTLNCGLRGDKIQNVLSQAHNLTAVKNVKNVILCGTNNLHAPENIPDGIIKIGSTFK